MSPAAIIVITVLGIALAACVAAMAVISIREHRRARRHLGDAVRAAGQPDCCPEYRRREVPRG